MNMTKLQPTLRRCVAVTIALLTVQAASATERPFDRVVAFGDSLMDPGNAFVLTGEVAVRPFEPIPAAPYLIGAFHFSNGATWVEQMARRLGIGLSAGPAFKNPVLFTNYAVGGSRARDGGSPFSASVQVMQFLGSAAATDTDRTLVVYGFGGNDVRDALEAGGDPAIIQAAVTATANNLIALCTTGARQILIANTPNLSITPAVQALGEPAITAAEQLSFGLNAGVDATVAGLVQPLCPDTTFHVLDLFGLSTAIASFPDEFGFTSSEPCLTFGVIRGAICRKPRRHFFWDAIHPTRAGHRVLARAAVRLVGPRAGDDDEQDDDDLTDD